MRSRTTLAAVVAAVVIGSFWMMAGDAQTERERIQEWNTAIVVPLSGDQQVPAVDSDATGLAAFWPDDDMSSICYMVHADDLDDDVTQVSVHQAQQGEDTGEAVLILSTEQFDDDDDDGVIAMGNITSQDLIGPMAGASMTEFFDEMEAGNLYVNVITDDHPGGEIRGNIDVDMTCDDIVALGNAMSDDDDRRRSGMPGGSAPQSDDDDNDG